jgi:hypothetical protein
MTPQELDQITPHDACLHAGKLHLFVNFECLVEVVGAEHHCIVAGRPAKRAAPGASWDKRYPRLASAEDQLAELGLRPGRGCAHDAVVARDEAIPQELLQLEPHIGLVNGPGHFSPA